MIERRRSLLAQSLVRTLFVILDLKTVEATLLCAFVPSWGPYCSVLKRAVEPFVTPILLRFARLD